MRNVTGAASPPALSPPLHAASSTDTTTAPTTLRRLVLMPCSSRVREGDRRYEQWTAPSSGQARELSPIRLRLATVSGDTGVPMFQIRKDGEDAPVGFRVCGKAQLEEDLLHVRLDRPLG